MEYSNCPSCNSLIPNGSARCRMCGRKFSPQLQPDAGEQVLGSGKTRPPYIIGVFATVMGLFILLVAGDVIHAPPESLRAPRWVLGLCGLTFFSVGPLFVVRSLGWDRAGEGIALAMLGCIAAAFNWVAFGPGERMFQTRSSFGVGAVSSTGDSLAGRVVFGAGAIFTDILLVYLCVRLFRRTRGSGPDAE